RFRDLADSWKVNLRGGSLPAFRGAGTGPEGPLRIAPISDAVRTWKAFRRAAHESLGGSGSPFDFCRIAARRGPGCRLRLGGGLGPVGWLNQGLHPADPTAGQLFEHLRPPARRGEDPEAPSP